MLKLLANPMTRAWWAKESGARKTRQLVAIKYMWRKDFLGNNENRTLQNRRVLERRRVGKMEAEEKIKHFFFSFFPNSWHLLLSHFCLLHGWQKPWSSGKKNLGWNEATALLDEPFLLNIVTPPAQLLASLDSGGPVYPSSCALKPKSHWEGSGWAG